MIRIHAPLKDGEIRSLCAGDLVLLSGTIYTARDAAHRRLVECIQDGRPLPFDIAGQTIYYAGPCPGRPGQPIGPAGPTTSLRMDPYSPFLLGRGLKGMIGKGYRSPEVVQAIVRHGAVYFVAVGGAAALIAKRVKRAETVAYEDLGPEAVRRLEVEDMPLFVGIDTTGRDIYGCR